jgi:hypothetical protein
MGVVQTRGGVPYVLKDSIGTGGRKCRLPFLISHLKIRNLGSNPVKLYFTEIDFTADENYVTIPIAAAITPYGEWEGPVETTSGDRDSIWLKSTAGSSNIELVSFQRRG